MAKSVGTTSDWQIVTSIPQVIGTCRGEVNGEASESSSVESLGGTMDNITTEHNLADRLERIERTLLQLVRERVVQEYYSTADVAKILGKSDFTVREWCRLGRVYAEKRPCGRGNSKEWMIAHDELERIQSEGLLPRQW